MDNFMNFGHKQFQSVGVVETLDIPLALVCHFLPTRNKATVSLVKKIK